jgi:hypothetical protein
MIEVFKTNVKDKSQSQVLIDLIHRAFPTYKANFDLDDCDRILRICGLSNPLQAFQVINLLKDFGVQAEVLPDDVQSSSPFFPSSYGFSRK